jgi:hypothetical protein
MAGLVPAIHVFSYQYRKNVDGRHKGGHNAENLHIEPGSTGEIDGAMTPAHSILGQKRKRVWRLNWHEAILVGPVVKAMYRKIETTVLPINVTGC